MVVVISFAAVALRVELLTYRRMTLLILFSLEDLLDHSDT